MTHKEMSDEYRKFAVALANAYVNIDEMREQCKTMSEETMDNGDPWDDLEETLLAMGGALASLVIYADEYGKEAKGKK